MRAVLLLALLGSCAIACDRAANAPGARAASGRMAAWLAEAYRQTAAARLEAARAYEAAAALELQPRDPALRGDLDDAFEALRGALRRSVTLLQPTGPVGSTTLHLEVRVAGPYRDVVTVAVEGVRRRPADGTSLRWRLARAEGRHAVPVSVAVRLPRLPEIEASVAMRVRVDRSPPTLVAVRGGRFVEGRSEAGVCLTLLDVRSHVHRVEVDALGRFRLPLADLPAGDIVLRAVDEAGNRSEQRYAEPPRPAPPVPTVARVVAQRPAALPPEPTPVALPTLPEPEASPAVRDPEPAPEDRWEPMRRSARALRLREITTLHFDRQARRVWMRVELPRAGRHAFETHARRLGRRLALSIRVRRWQSPGRVVLYRGPVNNRRYRGDAHAEGHLRAGTYLVEVSCTSGRGSARFMAACVR